MWVIFARSDRTKMDKINEYGFRSGLSSTSVNSRVEWINWPHEFVILSWHGFFFSILKQENTWKKVKVEIPPKQNNVCLPADTRLAWVFKSVLNINNRRSRIAYFTDEAQHLVKEVIFYLIFGVRIKIRHLFLRASFVTEVLMQATV